MWDALVVLGVVLVLALIVWAVLFVMRFFLRRSGAYPSRTELYR